MVEHIPCRYLMFTIYIFHCIENKHDVYREEGCIKKFFESLREHSLKIINFEKKKTVPLTNEHQELHENEKICYIYQKSSYITALIIKPISQLGTIAIILVNNDLFT